MALPARTTIVSAGECTPSGSGRCLSFHVGVRLAYGRVLLPATDSLQHSVTGSDDLNDPAFFEAAQALGMRVLKKALRRTRARAAGVSVMHWTRARRD